MFYKQEIMDAIGVISCASAFMWLIFMMLLSILASVYGFIMDEENVPNPVTKFWYCVLFKYDYKPDAYKKYQGGPDRSNSDGEGAWIWPAIFILVVPCVLYPAISLWLYTLVIAGVIALPFALRFMVRMSKMIKSHINDKSIHNSK